MRSLTVFVVLVLICTLSVPATAQSTETTKNVMNNADVVRMVKAGVSDTTIILAIGEAKTDFDVSADAIVTLKQTGVSEKVIDAMLNAHRGANPRPAQTTAAQVTQAPRGESGLRGVSVATLSQGEQKDFLKRSIYDQNSVVGAVKITHIDPGSPAAEAGLRPGDWITVVIHGGPQEFFLPGDPVKNALLTPEDFSRAASQCVPECLVGLIRKGAKYEPNEKASMAGPYKEFGGFIAVGALGTNFTPVYTANPSAPAAYMDQRTGTMYLSASATNFGCNRESWELAGLSRTTGGRKFLSGPFPGLFVIQDSCAGGSTSGSSAVQQEIATIRGAQHEEMPPTQATRASLGGQTAVIIENGTGYMLELFLSGPSSQNVQVPAGNSNTISIAPGDYEIAAKVSDPTVIPFYGKYSYAANTKYPYHFYISTQTH